jgi:hypothetical protein
VTPLTRHAATAASRAAALPSRIRHGRPARITARAAIAAAVAIAAARCVPGTPAAPAIEASSALWWAATLPPDLAPAPETTPATTAHRPGQEEP